MGTRLGSGRSALALVAIVVVTVEALVLGGCTDGITPDCSDAAAGCTPDTDATTSEAAVSEAATSESGSDAEVVQDADPVLDAKLDDGGNDADASGDAQDDATGADAHDAAHDAGDAKKDG